jgi:hypothetical protein
MSGRRRAASHPQPILRCTRLDGAPESHARRTVTLVAARQTLDDRIGSPSGSHSSGTTIDQHLDGHSGLPALLLSAPARIRAAAEKRFRRVRGYKTMGVLLADVRRCHRLT